MFGLLIMLLHSLAEGKSDMEFLKILRFTLYYSCRLLRNPILHLIIPNYRGLLIPIHVSCYSYSNWSHYSSKFLSFNSSHYNPFSFINQYTYFSISVIHFFALIDSHLTISCIHVLDTSSLNHPSMS